MKHGCGKCGEDATIVEQDVFYFCAKCWLKSNKKGKGGKSREQSAVYRTTLSRCRTHW